MVNSLELEPGFAKASGVASRQARLAIRPLAAREVSPAKFLIWAGCTCIVIWAMVWAYLLLFPMYYMDRDYPLGLAKAALAAECRPDTVAVFGDSRVIAGVMPKAIDIPIVNLASPGASPIENFFLVQRLLRCPAPPKLVVLAQSAAMYSGAHAFWNIYGQVGYLRLAQLRQVQNQAAALHDNELAQIPHPSGVPLALLPELYAVRFPPLYVGNLLGGYIFARKSYNLALEQRVIAASGHMLFGNAPRNDEVAGEGSAAGLRVTPLSDLYLRRTLAMLQNRHIKVAIVTMPVNQATCAHMSPVLQTELTSYLDGLARHDPDLVLAHSAIACWPDTDFNDNAHYNAAGALAFSGLLQAKLRPLLNGAPIKVNDVRN